MSVERGCFPAGRPRSTRLSGRPGVPRVGGVAGLQLAGHIGGEGRHRSRPVGVRTWRILAATASVSATGAIFSFQDQENHQIPFSGTA